MSFSFTTLHEDSWTDGSIEERAYHIPAELAETEQWITFRLEEEDGKTKKKPCSTKVTQGEYGPFVKYSGVRTEENFTDFMGAYNFVKETKQRDDLKDLDGVGFVFTEDDDYVGIDLDSCVNSENQIKQFANEFLGSVDSFAEFSPSGTGIHIIAKGSLDDDYQNKNDEKGIELYQHSRFFTVTGSHIKGSSKEINESDNIQTLQRKYMSEAESPESFDFTPSTKETADDKQVVKTAKAYSDKFARLYEGGSVHGNDTSRDDLAFVRMCAFWAKEDASQMKRIWLNSGRQRDKLDRDDYVERTISTAISSNDDTFSGTYVN